MAAMRFRLPSGTVTAAILLLWIAGAAAAASAPPEVSAPHHEVPCAACHPAGPETAGGATCTGGGCHAAQAAEFGGSPHDRSHPAPAAGSPGCADCHGGHRLKTSGEALAAAHDRGFDQACLGCHPVARDGTPERVSPVGTRLQESVHGRVKPMNGCTAPGLSCRACHGAHTIRGRSDPGSPINRRSIAATCGRCHRAEQQAYGTSIHGTGLEKGSDLVPTCVTCHGAHAVLPVHPANAPASATRVVQTCAKCHDDPVVIRRTSIPGMAVESYERSFHGLAYSHGVPDVATCVSCHGAHDVLPSSDPRSRTNPANLQQVCMGCHRQVNSGMLEALNHPRRQPGVLELLARLRLYFPVARSAISPFLVVGMGALVGFLSGLFGVGGGFLLTPLLIFIGIPAAVAAATDAAQITAGASSGALSHSRLGNVDFKMGLTIVVGGFVGGGVGVQLVRLLQSQGNFEFFLKLVYVLVLGFIGTTMLIEGMRAMRGRTPTAEPGPSRLTLFFARLPLQTYFPKSGLRTSLLVPVTAGFLVGTLAAFLGVGGGFIMLPTMIYIIGIPTRVAVGTDLFQIVLTSGNVALQQAITNHTVDILLAITLFLGSTVGAQFGVVASKRLRGEQIRVFLAVIVIVVMAILLLQLLTPPSHLIGFARSGGGH